MRTVHKRVVATWPSSWPSYARRFLSKIMVCSDGCWRWNGYCDPQGYGRFSLYNGIAHRNRLAHRVSYELFVGPIPVGLVLDHLCQVPACVNPSHLEPVTHGENLLRGKNPAAQNARKTHCKQGHPFPPRRVKIGRGKLGRRCLICHATRERERYARRKSE